MTKEDMSSYCKYQCSSCGTDLFFKVGHKKKKCSCGSTHMILLSKPKEKIEFNYDMELPSESLTIEEVEKVIKENFPDSWFETKACLAVCASMCLERLNGCPSLNLIGAPSGEKTTVLSFFYGQENMYLSDDFTPRAFVSHSANVKKEELESVDLLPKLQNKVLISPELAPLFEAPKDKLIDNFAILTRVLDGEGFNKDSGVHGHRGYSGDYKFAWLGASTPLRANVWNVMGKIGNRLFFLNMREKNRTSEDYLTMFSGKAYEEKVKICRGAVNSYLNQLYKNFELRSIKWDAQDDILLLPEIIRYATLLSKFRASLMTWRGEEKREVGYSFPIVEEPPRAINALYNIAKGNAILNGRTFLKKEDLEVVRAICFSSMPHDRFEFLKLLIAHEGKLTTQQIEKELNCSDETARRTMKTFEILGVVSVKSISIDTSAGGRPMYFVEIKDEFKEILDDTQVLNDVDNSIQHETKGVCGDYSSVKPEDFIKNSEKKQHTHHSNDVEKDIQHEKTPVSDEKTASTQVFFDKGEEKI